MELLNYLLVISLSVSCVYTQDKGDDLYARTSIVATERMMMEVNAHKKLMTPVVEELGKVVSKVIANLEKLKDTLQDKTGRTEKAYHYAMDNVIAAAELKIQSMRCKEGTVGKVKGAREYGWGNLTDCLALIKIYTDGKVVYEEASVFVKELYKLFVDVSKEMGQCNNKDILDTLHCVVVTIAKHSDQYTEKLDEFLSILNRATNITHEAYKKILSCIGNAENTITVYVDNAIAENCKEHSFASRVLTALGNKLVNSQLISSLKQIFITEGNRQMTLIEEKNPTQNDVTRKE